MLFGGTPRSTPESNGRLHCARQGREQSLGNGPLSEEAISDPGFKGIQKQELSIWQRQRGRPTQSNRKWAQCLCAWHHPPKNVRHLANGDSTVRLSHRRNFSVM